ncbi:Hypothetical_protein [Hexamita inflata]|uniref:Hypothetical_protein n=1 Tax=Hexamita inflata TaxID=28002 RepID=A0AA86QRW8_9EUKA|nr:Hypothetical protein HINF_LOCUS4154 [Hexamita inflata]CAI9960351.1 Hypothetical protein HINF_LOCUS47996 [Hexamita inflata]
MDSIKIVTGQDLLDALRRYMKHVDALVECIQSQIYDNTDIFTEVFDMFLFIVKEITIKYSTTSKRFMISVFQIIDVILQSTKFQVFSSESNNYIKFVQSFMDSLQVQLTILNKKPSDPRIVEIQEIATQISLNICEFQHRQTPVSNTYNSKSMSLRLNIKERIIEDQLSKAFNFAIYETVSQTYEQVIQQLKTSNNSILTGQILGEYILSQAINSYNFEIFNVLGLSSIKKFINKSYIESLIGLNSVLLYHTPRLFTNSPLHMAEYVAIVLNMFLQVVIQNKTKQLSTEQIACIFDLININVEKQQKETRKQISLFCFKNFKVIVQFLIYHKQDCPKYVCDRFFDLSLQMLLKLSESTFMVLVKFFNCKSLNLALITRLQKTTEYQHLDLRPLLECQFPIYVSLFSFKDQQIQNLNLRLIERFIQESSKSTIETKYLHSILELFQIDLRLIFQKPPRIPITELTTEQIQNCLYLMDEEQLSPQELTRIANLIKPPFENYYLFFILNPKIAEKVLFINASQINDLNKREIHNLYYWLSANQSIQSQELVKEILGGGVEAQMYPMLINAQIAGKRAFEETLDLSDNQIFKGAVLECKKLFRQ